MKKMFELELEELERGLLANCKNKSRRRRKTWQLFLKTNLKKLANQREVVVTRFGRNARNSWLE